MFTERGFKKGHLETRRGGFREHDGAACREEALALP